VVVVEIMAAVTPIHQPPTNETNTVEFLLACIRGKTIDLNPTHQRGLVHPRKWQEGIIGSIFVIKMIPPVYFHQVVREDDGRYVKENIDGKQRLTAILHYCDNEYKYTLDDVPDLKNRYFRDLTPAMQHTILQFKISVMTYECELDKAQIEYMFGRFNDMKPARIGEKLNACLNGEAHPFVKQIVEEGVVDAIQPTDTRNQRMECAIRMAFMVQEDSPKMLTNDALYDWFHTTTPFTTDDADHLRTRIRDVSDLMKGLELKNRNAKANYLAVLWFLMKEDAADADLLRTKGSGGRFAFPSPSAQAQSNYSEAILSKYRSLVAFVAFQKA
jgi:hypothetical protein